MANTQIIIDATDSNGRSVKKTVPNINPAATNEQLATFGTMLNQLTDNVYGNTTKITKVNCDGETGAYMQVYRLGDLENPCTSLTFDELNADWAYTYFAIVYDGNYNLSVEVQPATAAIYPRFAAVANGTPSADATGNIDLADLTINEKKVNYFAILEKDGGFQPHACNIIFKADDAQFTIDITE